MMTLGIIGATGFIGTALKNQIQKSGTSPLIIPAHTIKTRTEGYTEETLKGIDVLYYLASSTIPASSWEHPQRELELNLRPFINTMHAAVNAGVRKLIFVSSGGTVYGTTMEPVNETATLMPISPYGIFKCSMEYYLNYLNQRFNVQTVVYRVSNVYGPGQNINKGLGIINTFIERALQHLPVSLFGSGEAARDFIYIDDVAQILYKTADKAQQFNVYNLASGRTYALKDLLQIISNITGLTFNIEYKPQRASDTLRMAFNTSRLTEAFPEFQTTAIERGILNTYIHLQSQIQ
jgi:UDP-glucose 4-epimerase